MKAQEEYAEIFMSLMAANSKPESPEWIDDNMKEVLIQLVDKFNADLISEFLLKDKPLSLPEITYQTPLMMFVLGVLYGRREASELLS